MAKQDNNKKSRLRLLILAALVAAALLLGWCGRGWLGGGGESGDKRTSTSKTTAQPLAAIPADAHVPRCRLRVDKVGVQLGGAPVSVDAAVAACTKAREADLVVTGESKYGVVEELKQKLTAAGVRIYAVGSASAP